MQNISIRGARTHNLRNIDLDLPRDRLIVITGLSGSGKSSLAFDTIYAEGQRRYVESLSAYARQFLSMMDKPDVDHIEGLSPAISIEQKTASHNPRSTVGTVTEIYDYLRLLFARAGTPRCPDHGRDLRAQTVSQMVDQALSLPEGTKLVLLAPVVQARKGEHTQLLADLRSQGYVRARIDGEICELDDPPKLDLRRKHTIEVVVDRFKVRQDIKQRLAESFETALKLADGIVKVAPMEKGDKAALASLGGAEALFSDRFACPICSFSIAELEPRLFSFNNPAGACATCDGLGVKQFFGLDRVVRYPDLSLAGGAIRGWDRRNAYYFSMIQSLAKHYDFDIELPWNKLPGEDPEDPPPRQRRGEDPVQLPHGPRRQHQPQAPVRGHPPEPGAPLPGNRLQHGPGRAGQVPEHPALPRLQGDAAEHRRPQRVRQQQVHPRSHDDVRGATPWNSSAR